MCLAGRGALDEVPVGVGVAVLGLGPPEVVLLPQLPPLPDIRQPLLPRLVGARGGKGRLRGGLVIRVDGWGSTPQAPKPRVIFQKNNRKNATSTESTAKTAAEKKVKIADKMKKI